MRPSCPKYDMTPLLLVSTMGRPMLQLVAPRCYAPAEKTPPADASSEASRR